MPEKLMTLRELSEYLKAPEEKLISLVEDKSIPAYKIGGELLRFRKEQIDAMRSEIDSRINEAKNTKRSALVQKTQDPKDPGQGVAFIDSVRDFFYFNDFYIMSAAIAGILLAIIFMG